MDLTASTYEGCLIAADAIEEAAREVSNTAAGMALRNRADQWRHEAVAAPHADPWVDVDEQAYADACRPDRRRRRVDTYGPGAMRATRQVRRDDLPRCAAEHPDHPDHPTVLPCQREQGHAPERGHYSTSGCAGGAVTWPADPPEVEALRAATFDNPTAKTVEQSPTAHARDALAALRAAGWDLTRVES